MGTKKKVYKFDLEGNLITYYESLTEAAKANAMMNAVLSSAIVRGTCVGRKAYYSYDEKMGKVNTAQNPLLSKGKGRKRRELDDFINDSELDYDNVF